MSKKKIRQGQSRWVVWVYQEVNRSPEARQQQRMEATEEGWSPIVAGDTKPKTYHLERIEVVNVIDAGRKVIIKMSDRSNTSTWDAADFLQCPGTYRKARRSMLEAQARA